MDQTTINIVSQPTSLTVLSPNSSVQSNTDQHNLVLRDASEATIIVDSTEQVLQYEPTQIQVVTAGFQGPAGKDGLDAEGSALIVTDTVPALSTRTVTTFPLDPDNRHWSVTIETADGSKRRSYEVKAVYNPDTLEIDWVVFGIVGSRIAHATNFSHPSGTASYHIVNAETSDLNVTLTQL